jgi:glycosyltransferase involved in cell wall biosynthesis
VNQSSSSRKVASRYLTISSIIPIHIEAGNVDWVLEVFCKVDRLIEIIIVDDEPTDLDLKVSKSEGDSDSHFRLHLHAVNRGKGEAISRGWNTSSSLLLDCGLSGLDRRQVLDFMLPVLESGADLIIDQLQSGNRWLHIFLRSITWLRGQGYKRSNLLRQISPKAVRGCGNEAALTVTARQNRRRCIRFPLNGIWHNTSEKRRGLWSGIKTRSRIYRHIMFARRQSGGCEGMKCGYA